ncbi:MAG: cytochrome c peroxidase [Bryobacteraceae bacterium]|nr:cytochrome c peroxidase [Bryobacteraceae bacterium]
MMIRILLSCWLFVAATLMGATDPLLEKAQRAFKPIPARPPALAGNPATPDKVQLGKMLFFDPRLSASWLISCNTCHNLGLGGVDLLETSIGHGWQKGPRNSPTVLNAVFNVAQFWDGRAKDLKEQAMGPVQAAVEMNNKPDRVVRTLESIPEYVVRFKKAFPGDEKAVSFENMARAIEVFEATLITPGSRFDRYLGGDLRALNDGEKKGLDAFLAKGCVSCHGGVNAGGAGYFPFGVQEKPSAEVRPPGDKGRFAVTNTARDEYVFKSPSLRNIELTAPYFHSGKVWTLKEAVMIMGSSQLGAGLSEGDAEAITAFLRTLTGRQPIVEYPALPPSTTQTPPPVTGDSRGIRKQEMGSTLNAATYGDQVFFAGQPPKEDLAKYAARGVKVVINLRTAEEMAKAGFDERQEAEAAGMTYLNVPFGAQPPSTDDLDRIFGLLDEAGHKPVLIHCASSNRVGYIWSLYRNRRGGLSPEAALVEGKQAGLRAPALEKLARENLK